MKKIFTLSIFVLLCTVLSSYSQDRIYKSRSKNPIECKVIELGVDEIKYKLPDYADPDLVYVVDRNSIRMVVMESGQIINIEKPMVDPSYYFGQNQNMIKINFISPLYGTLALNYERSVKPGQSFEVGASWIGCGIMHPDNGRGFSVNGGYKLYFSPSYYLKGIRYAHLLKGGYFKPEIEYTYASYEDGYYYDNDYHSEQQRVVSQYITAMAIIGKQWVWADRFSLDIYYGLGYGFNLTPNITPYLYDYTVGNNNSFLVQKAGIRFGVLFGRSK